MASRTLGHGLVFALALLTGQAVAAAQEDGRGTDAMPRFSAMWSHLQAWVPPHGVEYTIRHEFYASMDEPEILRRLDAIEPTPHHPERLSLQRELTLARGGPERTVYQVWIASPDAIRVSTTTERPDEITTAIDTVITADACWLVVGSSGARGVLQVFDPSRGPPPGHNVEPARLSALRAIGSLFAAGLNAQTFSAASPGRAEVSPRGVVGIAADERRDVRVDAEALTGDGLDGVLAPSDVQVRLRESGRLSFQYRAHGWQYDQTTRLPVAARWERISSDGRVLEAFEWVGARLMLPGEFAVLAQVPTPDGIDPMRGPHTFSVVWDYRPGAGTYTTVREGVRSTISIPPSPETGVPIPRTWNGLGTVIAGGILATLVLIRWWRSKVRAGRVAPTHRAL